MITWLVVEDVRGADRACDHSDGRDSGGDLGGCAAAGEDRCRAFAHATGPERQAVRC
jgi:hypothetical protein